MLEFKNELCYHVSLKLGKVLCSFAVADGFGMTSIQDNDRKGEIVMRIMAAADIHGSAYYCRQLLEAFERENCEKLLLLGDILYHGPRNELPTEYAPKQVIEMLNAKKERLLCVRGNCDTEVDQMVLNFPILAEYCYLYTEKTTIFATHGHKFHKNCMPNLAPGEILLHGHTHVPACEWIGDNLYINPGSVSIPKEDSYHGYLMIDGDCFLWKSMEGTVMQEYKFRGTKQ